MNRPNPAESPRTYPWGSREVLVGVGIFILVFFTVNAAVVAYAAARPGFAVDDVGNAFERLQAVTGYGVERLAAARNGNELPGPPAIFANQRDLQYVLAVTLVSQVVMAGVVVYVSRQRLRGFLSAVGLDQIHPGRAWMVIAVVFLVYAGLFAYSLAAEASGISWLKPESTVPSGVTRDGLTLSITGIITLIGAPISEEMFFRGLVFSGLLRWGFWPAALASGGMFSLVHFDPGSFLPFVGIAVVLCWIYWRRGSLWDSIAFHFLFNATSYSIMVATR